MFTGNSEFNKSIFGDFKKCSIEIFGGIFNSFKVRLNETEIIDIVDVSDVFFIEVNNILSESKISNIEMKSVKRNPDTIDLYCTTWHVNELNNINPGLGEYIIEQGCTKHSNLKYVRLKIYS